MDSQLTAWPAPAKVNRFLHIIGRRVDGYHLLQTVFQFLDYVDLLQFRLRSDGVIRRVNRLPGIDSESDLSVRAAKLLQQENKLQQGVDIEIKKRIPMGGGLGGGSSDAATTLVALNYYWQLGLTTTRLAELGASIGADVPVFIHGQAAWAEGVGERLMPLPALNRPWFLVLIPQCKITTATVFADPALTRDSEALKMRAFITASDRNDCESVVMQQYPQVAHCLTWLNQFGQARMSGTGACVFAEFNDQASAEHVLAQLPADMRGLVSQGLNTSPLAKCLQQQIGKVTN